MSANTQQIKAAVQHTNACQAKLTRLRAQKAEILADARAARAEAEDIDNRGVEVLAAQVVSGHRLTETSLNLKRASAANSDLAAKATERAAARMAPKIAAAENDLAASRAAQIGPVLNWAAAVQAPLLEKLKERFAVMRSDLVTLATVDIVRKQMVGDAFTVPAGVTPPVAGYRVVEHILSALPAALRPEELSLESIHQEAAALAARFHSKITEA